MRQAEFRDVADLAYLEGSVFGPGAWSRTSVRALFGEGTLVLVDPGAPDAAKGPGEPAGGLAAYAAFRTVLDEAELLRVAVHPLARRRGTARRLLRRGFEILTARGVVTCHLEVRSDNAAALRLYGGLGFERVGRRPAYYSDGGDAVLLSKNLEDS